MALGAGEERRRKSLELSRHKVRACERCEVAFSSHQCPHHPEFKQRSRTRSRYMLRLILRNRFVFLELPYKSELHRAGDQERQGTTYVHRGKLLPQVIASSIPVSITQEKRVSRDGSVSTVLVMQARGPCFKSPAALYHRVKVCNLNAVCDRLLYPRPCLKNQRKTPNTIFSSTCMCTYMHTHPNIHA